MLLLHNPIQAYEWGDTNGIANLVDSVRTDGHEAELWVGTHPRGPSVIAAGENEGRTLAAVIAEDPERWLGPKLAATGATALPFLLKVLSIGTPLSLQAHPSASQAREGYEREEAAGIPRDAHERLYADPFPKPEMLVAVRGTYVLSGFRRSVDAAVLVEALGVSALEPFIDGLRQEGDDGLRLALSWLLHLAAPERASIAAEASAAAAALAAPDDPAGIVGSALDAFEWVARLGALHPGDPTCIAPLFLSLRALSAGASAALAAGNLHAYLEGSGIEIMAASDNVLRGGLTPKHVDVDELLRILRFDHDGSLGSGASADEATLRKAVTPTSDDVGTEADLPGANHSSRAYDPGFEQFGLVRVGLGGGPVEIEASQPSLLLAVGGEVDLAGVESGLTIGHGDAAFVAPGEGVITASGGGTLWWATTRGGLPTNRSAAVGPDPD